MPWKVETITQVVHEGRPDNAIGKIRLEDGTELIITVDYPNYPSWEAILHPDFLPKEIVVLREEVQHAVIRAHPGTLLDSITLDRIVARLPRESLQVGGNVEVTVQFGRWSPTRSYLYESPVTELIGSA